MPEETPSNSISPPGAAQPSPAPEAMAAEALKSAQEAIDALGTEAAGAPSPVARIDPSPFKLPDFAPPTRKDLSAGISLLGDVNLNVKIELGRTRMLVEDVLRLSEGSVVELDKLAGDPVDIYVNDRAVARGEVLVLNDNFCVRINEILAPVSADQSAGAA